MLTRIENADRLFALATELRAEHRKYAKMQERMSATETPKQVQKVSADLNWQAFHIVKIEMAFHAAAVDAGLADLRDAAHYATRSVKLTGFHEYQLVPAKPAQLGRAA